MMEVCLCLVTSVTFTFSIPYDGAWGSTRGDSLPPYIIILNYTE